MRLVLIVGPTATSKTELALSAAKKINADMLSADSRQVYRGLEIVSGVDIPQDTLVNESSETTDQYYQMGNTKIYGQSILSPDEEWSIAHFRNLTDQLLTTSQLHNKNLIIVGGSGLYLNSIFLDKTQIQTPPDSQLRSQLANMSVEQLQSQLLDLVPGAQDFMNQSDWSNPRRLIRKIELFSQKPDVFINSQQIHNQDSIKKNYGWIDRVLWIGLTIDKDSLKSRIEQRVRQRIEAGAIREVETLINSGTQISPQLLSSTGVKEILAYLNSQIDRDQLIEVWTQREFSYAKRQLTWFKKQTNINWFDISASDWRDQAESVLSS